MTKINRLVIDGFKSFGKFTELEFGNNFNVILGPNGSGKSNVLDSLCFVLGKSSSKSLRAEKSANLIYNGGKTKQPSKIAEVSIYFDNKNKIFPLPEEEIKVTRLVRHDGLSKYKINGKTKTRQELIELLSSAKIDPDGYNIILQGDIIRMIEMSSIERRQVIEEIAGISVYEEKKQQTISELTKVDQKIGEAEIVLKEREIYLKELKKDRDHALKYKELTDSLKKNKASYAKKRFDSKNEELSKLVEKSSELKEKLDKINNHIKNFREQISAKKEEIQKINEEIESKGEVELVKLQKNIESLKVEIATAKTKINSSQKEIEKLEQRKTQNSKSLEEVEQKIKEFEAQKKSFEETKKTQQNELEQLENIIKEFKIKHGIETSNQIEQEIDKIDKESEELQKQTQTLREEQQNQLREKDKNEFQLQTIEQRINKVLELEKEHKKEIDLLKKMKNEFKKTVLELNELLNEDSLKAKELGQKRESLMVKREELSKMESKHASMKESIHSNIAVQKILENKSKMGEVYGTVSELGSVSSKYSLSLEIAAGHKIHSVVVEDDKTAAKCIKYLKENKFGVATFLPINKIKTFPATEETIRSSKDKGVHGFATDLVNYDKKFKNVFSYVFGNTLVVDNIDVSRKIGIGSVRTVTLDGDLAEPSGAMIGGYRHKNFGSFKDNEIEEKISKNREEVEKLEREIESTEEWRRESDLKITRLREVKAGLEGDIIKTEKSLHLDSGDLVASQQYKEELEEQLKKNNDSLSILESQLNDFTEKVLQLKIKRQELRNKATELRKPTILAQLNAFDEKRKELSESVIKLEAEIRNINMQSNEIGYKERDETLNSLNGLEKEKKNFENEIETLSKEIKQKESELEQKEGDQKEFYSQYKSLFDKRNKAQEAINLTEGKTLEQEEKSRQEELQINTFSIEEARIKAEIAGIEIEITQYPGVEFDLEKSEEELKKSIASQERSLSAIGNVNMRALEIYEVTEKEYNGLIEKKESLKLEKEDVLNLMNEIEGSKKDLFMNSLNVINENFKRIFLDLSSKGDAFLEIENPEKLFEEGIRIKVKLAGEKFLDIRSLSGGEKTMTALAFLFAIQEHEPASFYVLDEVDAALDKHNSQLLANLIKKYCTRAQYIVISHNDAVISAADILYGVSMTQDVGISQVVSLAMEEAREKIQEIIKEEVASN